MTKPRTVSKTEGELEPALARAAQEETTADETASTVREPDTGAEKPATSTVREPDTGVEKSEELEPASTAEAQEQSAQPSVEELQERLRAAEAAQSEADRRLNERERQLYDLSTQQAIRDREARRAKLRDLKENDPEAYADEREREDEQQEAAVRAWGEYEYVVLDTARRGAQTYFPDITPAEFDAAHEEIDRAALIQQGRRANAVEVLAMVGEHRVRKSAKAAEKAQERIKELEAKVAALEGKRTTEIVENEDEGPEDPASGGGGRNGKLTLARWRAMTLAQRMDVPLDDEARMIREEMKQRSRR